ncbi:hypothetical protein FVD38_24295 [Massilia arenae]|uniref:Uncharacterized protein n=1 Tax=Massilia arenae TaxID=2603288 RepID=A0A5C7FLY2_9BURK|nr:hypothetical protein FVD38_24295 [Massilia arenae]
MKPPCLVPRGIVAAVIILAIAVIGAVALAAMTSLWSARGLASSARLRACKSCDTAIRLSFKLGTRIFTRGSDERQAFVLRAQRRPGPVRPVRRSGAGS